MTSTENCSSLTSTTASHWPDVPFDQIVRSATGPTFFSRKRLTSVTTSIWDASPATPNYRDIDTWTLDQSFPDPGDGTSAGLWLTMLCTSLVYWPYTGTQALTGSFGRAGVNPVCFVLGPKTARTTAPSSHVPAMKKKTLL